MAALWLFVVKYRYVLLGLSAAILVFGAGVYIRGIVAENASLKIEMQGLEDELEEATAEIRQCVQDKAITENVGNDYQRQITNLRKQLATLEWVRNNPACIPIEPAGKASGNNGAAAGNQLSGRTGLQAGYLLDFAGRAEETRLKLIGCQRFINQVWERNLND